MRAKLPFQHLDKTGWRNLAYAGIGIFYLIHFSLGIIQYGSLKIFGIDYLAFHGAARIANTVGYPASYDPSWLSKVEGSLAAHEPSDAGFSPNPAPFLPVFLIPFQILEPLGISLAYWAWTLVNLIALIFYTYFFVSKFTDQKAALKLILFVLLFLPTYQTLIFGQANVFLMICMGEFLRFTMKGENFKSGLWLAGLIFKPQTLIIILPALLIQRQWKSIGGFSLATGFLLIVSLALGGIQSFINLAKLWLSYVPGITSNALENMENWRMIGILISRNGLPSMGLLIAIIGSAATFLIALSLWWRPLDNSTTSFGIALLGTIAGTIITTWHSHLHMSLILLPALLFLYVKHQLPEWLVDIWIFAFPAIWILTLIIQEFMSVSLIPEINNFGNSVLGITGFLMNCVFLVWAITEHNKQNLASLRI